MNQMFKFLKKSNLGANFSQKVEGLLGSVEKVLKKKATCVFCKKTGHSESQCYKKKLLPLLMSLNENVDESAKEKKFLGKRSKEKICVSNVCNLVIRRKTVLNA